VIQRRLSRSSAAEEPGVALPRNPPSPSRGTQPLTGVGRCQNARVTSTEPAPSFYDVVGGHDTFVRLVDVFYAGVVADPELRSMYPEPDLAPAAHRLTMFLEQYWGGPTTYSAERGHPRLGMRHAPFAVNPVARDRWLAHMRTAVEGLGLPSLLHATLWDYLERAAHSMVNTFEE